MRSSRRWHFVLAAATAAAALVPQRGDPRPDPVTHPEWARMMLHGLELETALDFVGSASRAFAVLSWRQTDGMDATRRVPGSAHGVEIEPGSPVLLRASASLGEVSFPVTVVRAGEYRLRVRMAGDPSKPATLEMVPFGGGSARSFTLVPVPTTDWIEAPKPMHLNPGAYRATFALPRGAVFERLELAPRCIAPIEPLGGWRTNDVLDAEDLAVTLVQAVDRERDLPPADTPIDVRGAAGAGDGARKPLAARLDAGTGGNRVVVEVEVPVDGLYSLAAFGVRTAGQRWAADDCRSAVTCPRPSRLATWYPVMTAPLAAGRHHFTVDLDRGDAVERVRLERRKDGGRDYVDALQRMGFDPGEGPVSHEKASDALAWLRKQHRIELGDTCWDLGSGPVLQQASLKPPKWGESIMEPPATLPCQPPSSPVVPDPCPTP